MIDFPNSPSVGQVFSSGTTTWTFDGTKWVAAGVAGGSSIYLPLTGGTLSGPLTAQAPGSKLDNVLIGSVTPQPGAFTALQATSMNGGQLSGHRNRVINGDLRIDQRRSGSGFSAPGNVQTYGPDRFAFSGNNASYAFNCGQSTSVASGGPNFGSYAFYAQVATAYVPAAADFACLLHRIEGVNMSDLGWGGPTAQPCMLSFLAYSTVGGQHGGALTNASGAMTYPFSYTLAASTWTKVVIPVPGPTGGTWLVNNGIGVQITWDLGSGSSSRKPAGSWQAASAIGANGDVNVSATSGATLYIAAVQFEVGTIATPFEWRQLGTEMLLCQRYYQRYTGAGGGTQILQYQSAGGYVFQQIYFIPPMRAPPTCALIGTWTFSNITGGSVNLVNYGNTVGALYGTAAVTGSCTMQAPANGGYDFNAEL